MTDPTPDPLTVRTRIKFPSGDPSPIPSRPPALERAYADDQKRQEAKVFATADPAGLVTAKLTEVSAMIDEFYQHANRLGSKYGIHGQEVPIEPKLNAVEQALKESGRIRILDVLANGMSNLYEAKETFQITRIGDQGWGVYYRTHPPAAANAGLKSETATPLTKCRIDIKRQFLNRAGEFFQQYMGLVNKTVSNVEADLQKGRVVLENLKKSL